MYGLKQKKLIILYNTHLSALILFNCSSHALLLQIISLDLNSWKNHVSHIFNFYSLIQLGRLTRQRVCVPSAKIKFDSGSKKFLCLQLVALQIIFFVLQLEWELSHLCFESCTSEKSYLGAKSGLVEPLVKCIINEIPTQGISLPLHICSTISTMSPFVHST